MSKSVQKGFCVNEVTNTTTIRRRSMKIKNLNIIFVTKPSTSSRLVGKIIEGEQWS